MLEKFEASGILTIVDRTVSQAGTLTWLSISQNSDTIKANEDTVATTVGHSYRDESYIAELLPIYHYFVIYMFRKILFMQNLLKSAPQYRAQRSPEGAGRLAGLPEPKIR